MIKKKVLLGMSGGIDSSLAAVLLIEQGYEVIGLTMIMWDKPKGDPRHKKDGSQATDSIHEAKIVAEALKIPHFTENIIREFNHTVICYFIDEYLDGKTPNPCTLCNTKIKWNVLLRKAKELNCDYIATGHYAQIIKQNSNYIIKKAKDNKKDQSYFLWGLNQEILKKAILPLGEYTKDEIKTLAQKKGFVKLAQKKESQEICFIPDNNYRKFLREKVYNIDKKIGQGNFISTKGEFLGKHDGYPYYTIGQRKGLKIALGEPMYVVNIHSETNEIVLGKRNELYKKELHVKNYNLIKDIPLNTDLEVFTKVRYKSEGIKSKIIPSGNKIKVRFEEEVFAVTPGQSAVFYFDDTLIGGGIIE